MNYSAETKPGMADPYWYEWSVGQQYIIDMLNPDNNIKCVELQADVKLGLDDVVVTYEDGEKLFIQVKHTRADDTLTFGDLVSIDNSKKDEKSKYSLLGKLAKSWIDEKDKYQKTRVCLFTNRKIGKRVSSAGVDMSIKRPVLKNFWEKLEEQILDVKTFDEIRFPEYESAWDEWKEQLKDIEKDEDKLSFLRCLEIETSQVGLEEIKEDLLKRLQMVFNAKLDVAGILLMKLDHALRTWTTSIRKASCITAEDVYAALAVEDNNVSYNHDLIPAEPFFESRNTLVNELEIELKNGSSRVVFLSGIPGTGKTNIVMLNELDKELTHRGHRFVRYADDCMIFCKSRKSAERTLDNIVPYIEEKLFLKVNHMKTCVAHISKVKYLGYSFYRYKGKCRFRVHPKSVSRMKNKIRELTDRHNGWGNEYRALKLTQFIRGWVNYFLLADMKGLLRETDEWLRHKIRTIYWKQWKKVKTKFKELKKLGVEEEKAWVCANMRNGSWYCGGYFVLQTAFNNKKLHELGYPTFIEFYLKTCEN